MALQRQAFIDAVELGEQLRGKCGIQQKNVLFGLLISERKRKAERRVAHGFSQSLQTQNGTLNSILLEL